MGIRNDSALSSPHADEEDAGQGVVLVFSRHTPAFEDALLKSDVARKCIQQGVDITPSWANGAKIFSAVVTESSLDIELHPWHVVVDAVDEQMVHDSLRILPYNTRKMKPGEQRVPGMF